VSEWPQALAGDAFSSAAMSDPIPQAVPANQPARPAACDEEASALASDETLILDFQRGVREAFSELFARYREPIYGFFRRRLDDPARAEELAQEAFIAVIRAVKRYEPRATFRTYLYGIAMNLLMAERRKASRRERNAGEAVDPPAESAPENVLWVKRAIGQLDAEHREILMLREYEQLSYGEIGALLKLPVTTVRSRLFRARMSLKGFLLAPQPRLKSENEGLREER
jgi:RNA polymerase sigma-70 factor (ECF subfamily)